MRSVAYCLIFLLAACSCTSVHAESLRGPIYSERDRKVMDSPPYLAGHPDYRWSRHGFEALNEHRYDNARASFVRAARYADKNAQAMLAEMYWQGLGGSVDRARAYAWMDLAAERLYPRYIAHRERYWKQMDEPERSRALHIGKSLYAEFGDAVAKPRLETELRFVTRRNTGSRIGGSALTRTYLGVPPSIGIKSVSGIKNTNGVQLSGFNDPKFWRPQLYWEWQDEVHQSFRRGRVLVKETRFVVGEQDS